MAQGPRIAALRDLHLSVAAVLALALGLAPPVGGQTRDAVPVTADAPGPAAEPAAGPAHVAARLAERDRVLAAHGLPVPASADGTAGAAADPSVSGPASPSVADARREPRVAVSDVRLGLMQFALAAGPAGQREIVAALPSETAPALYLREGAATLSDLSVLADAAGHPPFFIASRNSRRSELNQKKKPPPMAGAQEDA